MKIYLTTITLAFSLPTQETFTTSSLQADELDHETPITMWTPITTYSGGQHNQTSYSLCQENNFFVHYDCVRSCSAGQTSCYEHCNRELLRSLQICCLLDQACPGQDLNTTEYFTTTESLTTTAPPTTIYPDSASTARQYTGPITSWTLTSSTEKTVEITTNEGTQTSFVSTTEVVTTENAATDTTSTTSTTTKATSSVRTIELPVIIITLLACLN